MWDGYTGIQTSLGYISFQNSASAFCVQTKIISLSVFKKILPKSNNVCNDKNMSTLTS